MQSHGFDDRGPLFIASRQDPANLQQAIEKLKSLYDGDRGLIEIAAYGQQAVPALRALLFERDPSGLFQARCRALHALVSLKAYDVVAEFLRAPR
ncbi:MAG: hypothetical protein FWD08_01570, partial [Alphaproteobacteria bacterium]|nr:hypothetical protein [Alphaproteobacteria bacterium]